MSMNRIAPQDIENMAHAAGALMPGLTPLMVLAKAGYSDYSHAQVLSMTFEELFILYAQYLMEKGDYTPGTHGTGQDPSVAAHHAEYAKVHNG